MGRLLWWGNVALALATALSLLSPYVAPEGLWPVAFAGLAFPTLVMFHIAALGWWLLRRPRRAWLSALCLAASLMGINALVGFGESPNVSALPDSTTLTLVNYNLLGGRQLYSKNQDAFRQNLTRLDERVIAGADVIALQETPSYQVVRDSLDARMEAHGIAYHYYPKGVFVSLHTRWRLIDPKVIGDFNTSNGALTALIAPWGGDTVRVFAAHLQSNSVRLSAKAVVKDAAKDQRRAYWKLRSVASNYRSAARIRAEQAAQLARAIRASRYPVVVLGDLNDTPQSYAVHELMRAGLTDSFRESGRGWGVSYPGTIPGLRIDYLMASEGLRWLDSEVIDVDYSDHKPVRGVVALR